MKPAEAAGRALHAVITKQTVLVVVIVARTSYSNNILAEGNIFTKTQKYVYKIQIDTFQNLLKQTKFER
jgi:hypothetical protein